MPGKEQLRQFSEDVLKIGNELKIRAERGEKPSVVRVTDDMPDINDADDFVMGMPESADDDGAGADEADELDSRQESADESGLDLADLLDGADMADADSGLSEFMPPVPEEAEGSAADDLDLDALLSSSEPDADSDAPSAEEPQASSEAEDAFAGFETEESGINLNDGLSDELNEGIAPQSEPQPELDIDRLIAEEEASPAAASEPAGDDFDLNEALEGLSLDIPQESDEPDAAPAESDDASSEPDMDAVPEADADIPATKLDIDEFINEAAADSSGDMNADQETAEAFETSELDGMEFSPAESDTPDANGAAEFEMDEFPETKTVGADFDPDTFEIPGFSDSNASPFDKSGKIKLAQPDLSHAVAGEKPKNTFTDEEYKKFQQNLAEYPLNVRVAVEDFIIRDEFTDDAIFELLEKIRDKEPVRAVASHLEKMMDITLSVPRDFERRTASQYEAYKRSFEYQLKNRIIPGAIAVIAAGLVIFGLVQFTYRFIYKPVKANILYSQGYELLEQNEYPLSESRFNEAAKYHSSRKWFFRYARAYREHKQYGRAADMYKNILYVYNHDREAGLEYAEMELFDRENYSRAEEIVRREVLDYHINDKAGMLMLGDVYLQWATERDPGKFEDARLQYAELIDLYGQNDLYMSRMMRYFIRTDNLREVLNSKNLFFQNGRPRKKALAAEDWTELSGYLLEKEYSELSPSEEYLRASIEDVRSMLQLAVEMKPANPIAQYNFARYYVLTANDAYAISALNNTISVFEKTPSLRRRDLLKFIDTYRMLGEVYTNQSDMILAESTYGKGIDLFERMNNANGFAGDENVGKLYADVADIDYFISGDFDNALRNYQNAVRWQNDVPSVRYKIGYIQYTKQNFEEALGSFIATEDRLPQDTHLLLALSNTLAMRGDNHAASGYYDNLLQIIERRMQRYSVMLPQVNADEGELVDLYMKATNNWGVALHRIASQTGSSDFNARSMVLFSESARAWDALTRNQETMVRLDSGNLAAQNTKYIINPLSGFEPAVYTDIPYVLEEEKKLEKKE